MKLKTSHIIGTAAAVALTFGLVSLSCKAHGGSANVAFADTSGSSGVPTNALGVTEALQSTFRSVSNNVLPAVVEIDVKEKKSVQTPSMDGWPFFFFGLPEDQQGDKKGNTREYEQSATGSGVIVRRNGKTIYVLTNNHVAGAASSITIKLNDGREFEGKLVGADSRIDVALVSFDTSDKDITIATLGDSDKVQTGDICLAMGTPLGYFQSVTQGIVSATGRSGSGIGSISDFIQTDAAINQGNSGGPLVNIYGEIIGINTWIASNSGGSQGLGFAIPINNIKHSIDQFISKGKVSYGWIGVSLLDVSNISKDYKKELGIDSKNGAFAENLFIGSPAQKGGMKAGDFIIGMNGHDIKSTDQLVREVGNLLAGDTATFKVIRAGKEMDITVKIEERSDKIASDNTNLWPGFLAIPLTDEIRSKYEIDKKVKGIVVGRVIEKTPAAALRLRSGDVITAVNDKKVSSIKDFYDAMNSAGNEVWFDIYSDGHTVSTNHYKLNK